MTLKYVFVYSRRARGVKNVCWSRANSSRLRRHRDNNGPGREIKSRQWLNGIINNAEQRIFSLINCLLLMFLIHSVQLNLTTRSIICFVSLQTKMKWKFFGLFVFVCCSLRALLAGVRRAVCSTWVTLKMLWDRSDSTDSVPLWKAFVIIHRGCARFVNHLTGFATTPLTPIFGYLISGNVKWRLTTGCQMNVTVRHCDIVCP